MSMPVSRARLYAACNQWHPCCHVSPKAVNVGFSEELQIQFSSSSTFCHIEEHEAPLVVCVLWVSIDLSIESILAVLMYTIVGQVF
jgi:hypothetical protein